MSEKYRVPIPWKRILGSIISLIGLLIISLLDLGFSLMFSIYFISAVIGGWYFFEETIEEIRKPVINIDVIMTIAILGSAFLGAFEESLTIVFLYSITETLESYTKKRTRRAICSLMKLVPKTARKLENNDEIVIEVDKIRVGDILLVRPGDSIPVDGTIIEGYATIDESSITGESVPVTKGVGDKVFGGTICNDGIIKYKADKVLSESTVAKVISLVEEAQNKKAPIQLAVSKFTRIYNPFVVVLGLLVFIIPVIFGGSIDTFLRLSITVMVAAAPCALAISTPVSVSAAIGSAGKQGVLAKGGVPLQTLSEIEAIAFDKTGTLTYGSPVLDKIITHGVNENEALIIAGSLERYANHPLAKAILEGSKKAADNFLDAKNFNSVPGFGVSAIINGQRYYIGNEKFVEKVLGEMPKSSVISKSSAFLFNEDSLLAEFVFKDKVKDDAKLAIQMLKSRNIEVFMLTGDKSSVAKEIAQQLGIPASNVFAELTPEDKMRKIEELKSKYKLAMVGDGINDAPALALADLGIAIGTAGTDVALETADIALMNDNLVNLVHTIDYSKRMKKILMQNLVVSTLIIFGAIIGVLVNLLNLTEVILIHEGSEMLIVANSLRLLTKKI